MSSPHPHADPGSTPDSTFILAPLSDELRQRLDPETLRLEYAAVLHRMDLMDQKRKSVLAELAALPPAAAAIIGLFVAFRPEGLPNWLSYLYAGALVPFLLLAYMSIRATDDLSMPEAEAEVGKKITYSLELEPADQLPVLDWLAERIVAWRVAANLHAKVLSPVPLFVRRVRIVFAILVSYLSLILLLALLNT